MSRQKQCYSVICLPKQGYYHEIVLNGDIDIYMAPRLKAAMDAILSGNFGPVDRIIIHTEPGDFLLEDGRVFHSNGLKYLDSTGIDAILGGLKRARKLEGDIYLIISDPRIRRIFEIGSLDRVFKIYSSREELENGITQS